MNLELSSELSSPIFHLDADGYCHIEALGIKERWSLYNNQELILIGYGRDIKYMSHQNGNLILRTVDKDYLIQK